MSDRTVFQKRNLKGLCLSNALVNLQHLGVKECDKAHMQTEEKKPWRSINLLLSTCHLANNDRYESWAENVIAKCMFFTCFVLSFGKVNYGKICFVLLTNHV